MQTEKSSWLVRPFADITPFSSVDWPAHIVATLFTQGCPLCCPYCYNSDMQPTVAQPASANNRSWSEIQDFLISRIGLLDGVVFSGGEPLIHAELPAWINWCKRQGYKVGLHTSGILPESLAHIHTDLDWIGFDFKAPFAKYRRICNITDIAGAVKTSLEMVIGADVPHEIRTVYDPMFLNAEDIEEMRSILLAMGATRWTVKPRLFA